MTAYLQNIHYYFPELIKALKESGIMLFFSIFAAMIGGLPLGTFIYLTRKQKGRASFVGFLCNRFVDIVRSFPFLLLVVALIPVTRMLLGTAFGTYAATFPLAIVAIALYARLVEQVLLEVPEEVLILAQTLGSNRWQLIVRFLYVEARSGLVLALTSVFISMLSYSTVMGVIGGGGIGDFAIRYGYQRYEYGIMYMAVILMVLFVSCIQIIGNRIAKKINKK